VSPLEMASIYAVLANKGKARPPSILKRVVGPDSAEIPLGGKVSEQVVSEQEAYIITSLLESVVETGTGAKAKKLGRPAAGKTGTSNEQRDAWFVGFTPDMACAVWVGYDDLRSIGRKEYGAQAALPIWTEFMVAAHQNTVKSDFVRPTGIIEVAIDPATGLLAYEGMEHPLKEVFVEGTEPTEISVPPDMVSPEGFLMDQIAADRDAGAETEIKSAATP
jgi:penicillin-binding protein 1A